MRAEIKYFLKSIGPIIVIFGVIQGTVSYFNTVHGKVPPPWFSPILLALLLIYVVVALYLRLYHHFKRNVKIFYYNYNNGTMWNQDIRNIAFRVETVNRMFGAISNKSEEYGDAISSLASKLQREELHNIKRELDGFSQKLKQGFLSDIGYEAGVGFAIEVLMPHYSRLSKVTDKKRIDIWCEYDSDVGWGEFINELSDDIQRGRILVDECFLTYTFGKKICTKTCRWMEGYIRGIIEAITGKYGQYIVKSVPEDCQRFKKCCLMVEQNPEKNIEPQLFRSEG